VVVSADALPELEADEFYWHQLEGLKVYSSYSTEDAPVLLGEVSHLLETGANDVLVVKACKGSIDNKERLLPYRPEVIENIDLAAGRIDSLWDPEF
jgi:16S rRNA processing protein RimM